MDLKRIVVGVDGSACAATAARWAATLAELSGAEIVAVHALGLLDKLPDGELVAAEPRRDEIRAQLESSWTQPLAEAGVTYRAELRDGDAVSVLLGAADDVGADLIVVGSRGMGGYPELLLGSTSTQVAQRGTRPVVIVPAAADAE